MKVLNVILIIVVILLTISLCIVGLNAAWNQKVLELVGCDTDEGIKNIINNKNNIPETEDNIVVEPSTQPDNKVEVEHPVNTLLLDQLGVRVYIKNIDYESFIGPEIKLYIENTSDNDYIISGGTCIINGYSLDGILYCEILSNTKINDSLWFYSSDFTTNNIDKIEVASIRITINDSKTCQPIYTELITFRIN